MYNWKLIDDIFLNYLRTIENRIPKTDYGKEKLKPFFGVLFETDDLYYVTQISSPKKRHDVLRPDIDFLKFYHHDKLLFVVNLNYMFPVPKDYLRDLTINDILAVKNEQEAGKYIALLKRELKLLNNSNISKQALKLYQMVAENPDSKLAQRCFNYRVLESACKNFLLQQK